MRKKQAKSGKTAKDSLPLKPMEFDLLLALVERDAHGYALVKHLEEKSPGGGKILPGALYRTLNRLATNGLVEESDWRPDPMVDDQRRRYFRITELGRRVATAEAERMRALVEESAAKRLIAPRTRSS